MALVKLYTTKTPTTAADLLNDKVLPFFNEEQLPMLRFNNRGSKCYGRAETHDYQLYLAINYIEHSITKVRDHRKPMLSFKSFHKTMSQVSYLVALRENLYNELATLQKIWTIGSTITIISAPIKVKCIMGDRRGDLNRWQKHLE